MAAIFVILGVVAYTLLLIIGRMLWRAFVGTKLWLWFVVPQFGLAPLPIAIAIGLSILSGLYSRHDWPEKKEDKNANWKILAKSFLFPALSLLTGYIVLQYR